MKTNIKSIIAVVVIMLITTSLGFSQEKKIDLSSPEVQKEVFNQILNDHQLMMNFMEQMKTNDHAMKMAMSDMMKCCDMDASTCKDMSAIMAEHDKILEQVGKILDEKEDAKYTVQKKPRYHHK